MNSPPCLVLVIFFFLWYELQVAFIRGADINLELVGIAGPSPVPQAEEAFYVPQLLQPALWKAVGFQPWRDVRLLILLTCANKWRWGEPPWAQPQKRGGEINPFMWLSSYWSFIWCVILHLRESCQTALVWVMEAVWAAWESAC